MVNAILSNGLRYNKHMPNKLCHNCGYYFEFAYNKSMLCPKCGK